MNFAGRIALAVAVVALGIGAVMGWKLGGLLLTPPADVFAPDAAPSPPNAAVPPPPPPTVNPPTPLPEAPVSEPTGLPNLAGVVVDQAGQPVAGAEVTAYVAEIGAERIRSGADGAFAFYGLVEGRYRVSAVADGFNEAVIESAAFGSLALTLALEPLSAAAGVVLDAETREPIGEFDVAYLDAPPDGEAHWQRLVAANRPAWRSVAEPSGVFRFDSLASGVPFAVAARAKGRQPAFIVVDALQAGEEATGLVIYLKAAPRVEGTVEDSRGEPIAGARILLGAEATGNTVLDTTDEAGAFSIDGLTGGSVELTAIHPNARPATEMAALMPGRTARVDFVLDAGAGVEGYVTRGGEPLAGAMVFHFASERRGVGAQSGSDGYYRLEGLPAGPVIIAASMSTDPGPTRMETRDLAVGTLERIDFDFPAAAASIEGFVTRDGEPVANVMIRAALNDGGASSPFGVNGATGDDGRYVLEELGAGVYTVVARQGAMGQTVTLVVGEGERLRQDFALGAGAGLSGSVSGLAEGEAAEIMLLPAETVIDDPSAFGSEAWLALVSRSLGGGAVEGGAFRLEGVQAGSYLAVVVAFNPEGAPGVSIADTVRIAQRFIEIGEGEQLTVDFELAP